MIRIFWVVAVACWPLVSLGQTDITTKIDVILHSGAYNGITPGLSVGVLKNGKMMYSRGYGFANLEYDIPNSDSSVFDIASMAKQFTAACVWTLINKGALSLDDDIRKYLLNFRLKILNLE